MRKQFYLAVLLVLGVFLAKAGKPVKLLSPDKSNEIVFQLKPEGLFYSIKNNKKLIIDNSLFAVYPDEGNWMQACLSMKPVKKQSVNETYQLPFGKRSTYINHYNELWLEIINAKNEKAIIELRAYDDGTAFRFVLKRPGDIKVNKEQTQFNIGTDKTVYVQKWDKAYEGFYDARRLDTINKQQVFLFPALVKANEQTWCLITEATTCDHYPGTQLQKDETLTSAFTTVLPQSSFTVKDSLVTPWRVFITGDLATVTESSLVDHLNPPSQITDMSWIKPGVAVFPWWADHLASSNEEVLRKYVDAAAAMGWEWIEFDVALVGTDYHTSRLWESTGWIAEFIQYAHSKNIKVYGWDELKALNTPEKRASLFGKYRQLGIDGIKIDFLDSDKIEVMRFHREALEDAAKYKLMVSFHGETLPRGLRRTWPNLLTHEAVRGAEYYTFPGYPEPNPVHNTTLPFTRNVVGSMDYTPCTFSAKTKKTTHAHELALPFVFESGWQVMADAPEYYLQSPAKNMLQKLEAAWDETKLIDGYPGKFAIMARRKHHEWFIAGINAGETRTLRIDLNTFKKNIHTILVYTDDENGSSIITKQLTAENNIVEINMKPNGGFVFVVN